MLSDQSLLKYAKILHTLGKHERRYLTDIPFRYLSPEERINLKEQSRELYGEGFFNKRLFDSFTWEDRRLKYIDTTDVYDMME